MQQRNPVLSFTIDQLANNALNHLKDEDVSALHHLILKLTEPLTRVQENLLLTFWNHACTASLPSSLLHRCNTILQQLGRNPMEKLEEELEMY